MQLHQQSEEASLLRSLSSKNLSKVHSCILPFFLFQRFSLSFEGSLPRMRILFHSFSNKNSRVRFIMTQTCVLELFTTSNFQEEREKERREKERREKEIGEKRRGKRWTLGMGVVKRKREETSLRRKWLYKLLIPEEEISLKWASLSLSFSLSFSILNPTNLGPKTLTAVFKVLFLLERERKRESENKMQGMEEGEEMLMIFLVS